MWYAMTTLAFYLTLSLVASATLVNGTWVTTTIGVVVIVGSMLGRIWFYGQRRALS
jgi:hypothetical protein